MNVHRLSLPSSAVRSTPDGASVSSDAEALSSEQLLRGRREIGDGAQQSGRERRPHGCEYCPLQQICCRYLAAGFGAKVDNT